MSEPDAALPSARGSGGRRLLGGVAAGVAAIAVALVVLVLWDGADEAGAPTTSTPPLVRSTTTTTTRVGTTTTTTTTTTTGGAAVTTPASPPATPATIDVDAAVDADVAGAVWPWAGSGVRYADPVAAARGFAVDFIGFTDPLLGEFRAGDARSGEVEVRAVETFAPTTVFVRQLGPDDSWWVVGSATANIVVDTPAVGQAVTSPLALSGRATAFEGTVDVQIRADGEAEAIFTGFVTGGGAPGELEPFAATLDWPNPGAGLGALVLTTSSADDGRILEAAVVRLRFAPG